MRPLRTPLPSFAVAMTVLLAITTIQHLANAERCADVAAPGHHTCEQHAAWGKCEESWIADGGYCRRTCGKCSAGSANGVLSAVTERAKACGLDDATREDVAQELRSLLSSPSFDRAEDDDDDQLAVRERSNNPLMATLALPEFGARLNRWVSCMLQHRPPQSTPHDNRPFILTHPRPSTRKGCRLLDPGPCGGRRVRYRGQALGARADGR